MGIKDTIGVRRSKQQGKTIKSTPVSEGGLGLKPNENSGSIDDAIRKAKENFLAQYWYDKYEKAASAIIKGEIRGDVADNFRELYKQDYNGNSTFESIHSGIYYGIIDEIQGRIDFYKKKFKHLKVILTGGDSNKLPNRLKSGIFADSNFIGEGLLYLLKFNL